MHPGYSAFRSLGAVLRHTSSFLALGGPEPWSAAFMRWELCSRSGPMMLPAIASGRVTTWGRGRDTDRNRIQHRRPSLLLSCGPPAGPAITAAGAFYRSGPEAGFSTDESRHHLEALPGELRAHRRTLLLTAATATSSYGTVTRAGGQGEAFRDGQLLIYRRPRPPTAVGRARRRLVVGPDGDAHVLRRHAQSALASAKLVVVERPRFRGLIDRLIRFWGPRPG